jgi:PhzF family phenazine biosynthesis protein
MATPVPLFHVDSFTDELYKGNPAGVCLLTEKRPDEWMQAVAAEMNLSETAFVLKAENDYDLRWFTPKVEMDLCGHATLASAHILWETDTVPEQKEIRFQTRSGLLTVSKQKDWIEMNFPARSIKMAAENEGLIDAVGAIPEEIYQSGDNLLLVYENEQTIQTLKPNFAALKEYDFHGIIVTSPALSPQFDFISRFFAPRLGINEDPVTGSSHCTLAPFWREKLHKDSMIAFQASARGGILKVRVSGERVYISGKAVTVFGTVLRG